MNDDQSIQFLMDEINYFIRKIRQCKNQHKELKQGLNRMDQGISQYVDFGRRNMVSKDFFYLKGHAHLLMQKPIGKEIKILVFSSFK